MHVSPGRAPRSVIGACLAGVLLAAPVAVHAAGQSMGTAADTPAPAPGVVPAPGPLTGTEVQPALDELTYSTTELGEIADLPPSPRRVRWFGRASLGAAYRWGFDESMLGAALEGELGAQNQRVAGGVRMRLEAGRLLAGLPYQVVTFGPFVLWTLRERFRVGVGIDGGSLLISRRTLPGRAMWSVMIGGQATAAADLLRIGVGALYLGAEVGVHALTAAPGPLTVSTTLALGYRP